MPRFQEYVTQWKDIIQTIKNKMTDIIIPIEYMELLKQYKEIVDYAKDALMHDDTIVNKDKEWADHGLDCYDILILPYIEYGISNGIDQHVIMNIFQSNKDFTPYEKKINDYLQKIYKENPDNIESLMNDLINSTFNPDMKPSYLLDELDQVFNLDKEIDKKLNDLMIYELDQIGID
jgi:hypothetical protein